MPDVLAILSAGMTILAAAMVAANFGPRITGLGFIVFSLSSIGWIFVASMTNQQSLLVTNIVLLLINLLGIWRWLGLRARYARGADAANRQAN